MAAEEEKAAKANTMSVFVSSVSLFTLSWGKSSFIIWLCGLFITVNNRLLHAHMTIQTVHSLGFPQFHPAPPNWICRAIYPRVEPHHVRTERLLLFLTDLSCSWGEVYERMFFSDSITKERVGQVIGPYSSTPVAWTVQTADIKYFPSFWDVLFCSFVGGHHIYTKPELQIQSWWHKCVMLVSWKNMFLWSIYAKELAYK